MADASVIQTTGKRKNAIARVFMTPGEGKITINGRPMDSYLGRDTAKMIVQQPLVLTNLTTQFDISVNASGGGLSGQAEAIRHGISKGLLQFNPELRKSLKKVGYLTRDSRVVERKKFGRHKARKSPQFSKR